MHYKIEIDDILMQRYHVKEHVGSGSFGAVFSAIDLETGERVAIKSLPGRGQQAAETQVARFQREMKVISTLVHRNIIGMYDFGQSEHGVLFMVLEYVDGQPLNRALDAGGLAPRQVVLIGEQIGSALLLAHHRGIIHRDLKPANIMLVEERGDYVVKILDFGTAKLLRQIDDDSLEQLTREGMAVGTPRYIAPEQARGQEVGPWSDLYAVGLLMYEMLTGARAVKADDVEGAVSAHVSPHPLQLDEINQVPQAFRPILARLIEKDPQKRYRSADQLVADLDAMRFQFDDAMGGSVASLDPRRARVAPQPSAPQSASASPGAENNEKLPPTGAARRRAHAQQLLKQSQQAQSIEVDWEQHQNQKPTNTEAYRKTTRDAPSHDLFRAPDSALEWAEACAAPLVALFCFILLGAQLHRHEYAIRLGIGLSPMVAALAWSILSARGSWRFSFFRLWILFSLAAGLIAHAMGTQALITELFRSSAWFLEPVRGLPGIDTLGAALGWVMRWYATLLASIIEWGQAAIR